MILKIYLLHLIKKAQAFQQHPPLLLLNSIHHTKSTCNGVKPTIHPFAFILFRNSTYLCHIKLTVSNGADKSHYC